MSQHRSGAVFQPEAHGVNAAGVVVPRDISVAGFDDIEFAEAYNPPLTTVRQARRAIGEQAAGLLLRLIAGETPAQQEFRLAAELVIRKSTDAATNRKKATC